MGITFNKVPEIKSGDAIKSKHLTDLGVAINQRFRSGLGDPTWRLVWYANSLATQFRNPDESQFLWPSKSEWLEIYATVHPADSTFPIQEADTAEGCNLATPIGQYVFGDSETNNQNNPKILPEDDRLLNVPMGDLAPSTPIERWGIAKLQRGGWDPVTNAMACPVFDAARQHYRMTRDSSSPHGNSWGGFAPTPEKLPDPCSDGTLDFPASPNFKIVFTHLSSDRNKDVIFQGTCPRTAGHVAAIRASPPFEYFVFLWTGNGDEVVQYTATRLTFSEYIEGPYSGGNFLTKQFGDHLPRVLNYFSAQYRGTAEQRAVAGSWNDHAFDTQRFFETQYLLAPANGKDAGGGQVTVVYPLFRKINVDAISKGTKLPKVSTPVGTSHTVADKCVVASLFVETHDLANEFKIEILADGVVVDTITINPTSNPTDILVLTKPVAEKKVIEIRIADDVGFKPVNPNTGITVELAEIMAYKPWPQDHFLVLRLGGCRIELENGTDGFGDDEQAAYLLSQDYFRWGCILNLRGVASPPGSLDIINTNAVHEAARQLFRCVRILRPEQLISYEVSGGNSILTFDRWTEGTGNQPTPGAPGTPPPETEKPSGQIVQDARYTVRATGSDSVTYNGTAYVNLDGFRGVAGVTTYTKTGTAKVYLVTQFLPDSDLGGVHGDCLAGIAPDPSPIVTGQLRWKRKYQVWGTNGAVTYNGKDYTNGQAFTAAENKTDFTSTGDVAVYEADGIKHTAEPENFTNEWLMGFQFKGFNNKDESIWKPDAYSRYFSFSERCHFYPDPNTLQTSDPQDSQAIRQFAYGQRIWLAPEAPTAYRYALELNDISDLSDLTRKKNFYKSCRLYEPDLEIDKAELVNAPQGTLVKITMKGRFHYDPSAAVSFGPDPNTWNSAALRAEPYRTTDNALREFLYYKAKGINPTVKVGDSAQNSQVYQQFDAPYGTVWPHIFFTKLIPTPYVDNNDSQDYWDTPFLHDQLLLAELYLRVMCEGYVDGKTSAAYGCQTGIQAIFDYTFQNLCFDAFTGRWLPALPSQATQFIPAANTRPDRPQGFGVLPNTIASAEQYNLFAKSVNKLTTVRVMLPSKFQQQKLEGTAYLSVIATNPDKTVRNCEARPSLPGVIFEGTAPDPQLTPGPWEDSASPGIDPGVGSGFNWSFTSFDGGTTYACDGNMWVIAGHRISYNFRWTLMDPDASLAIPDAWRAQIDVDGSYLGHLVQTTENQTTSIVDYASSADCLGSLGWWPVASGQYLKFNPNHTTVKDECGLFGNSGTISAPSLPSQVMAAGYNLGRCPVDTGSDAQFTPIPNDGFALTIPLVTPVPPIPAPG